MREQDIDQFVRQARVKKGPRKGERLAENSRQLYQRHVRTYFEWLQENGFEDWYDVKPRDIGSYLTYRLEENGSSSADVTNHAQALKRFYEWLGQDYARDKVNPAARHLEVTSYGSTETLRKKKGYEKGISDEEYQQLLDNVGSRHRERDKLIIRFLGEMGLRRAEVSKLKVDSVRLDEGRKGRLYVPDVKSSERHIPLPVGMKKDVRRWKDGGQREAYQYASQSDRLFLSERSESLSGEGINKVVKKAAENAGIQESYQDANGHERKTVTAHQLRHYFGQKMFDEDEMSLKALSEYMGHSSVDITADRYGDMNKDQVFDMLDKQFQ
ncbi:Site-specific recombinase XerD [Halorientalis persicus]|uniref:Site-specific recombinase XerD n=1 Tax=Halorientalis persicus TaxID=1367881 RepID=A0A1H8T3U9_9EURY|nr:tyrosine-type recombinase/integrase [Halorientalis persicus]SEO85213.1 Site-specific recombinase XerD [Halorientalis persicus]